MRLSIIALVSGMGVVLMSSRLEPLAGYWLIAFVVMALVVLARGDFGDFGDFGVYGAFVFAFMLGSIYAILWGLWGVSHQLSADLENKNLIIEGRVDSLVREKENSIGFTFKVLQLRDVGGGKVTQKLRRVHLSWRQKERIPLPGECWQFYVRMKRIRGFSSPGAFDYSAKLFSQGIDAAGYILDKDVVQRNEDCDRSNLLLDWRLSLKQTVREFVSPRYRAMSLALLIGDSSEFTADNWTDLRRSGTLHLMVVSGLHIGLFAGIGFVLCGGLVRMLGMGELIPSYPVAVIGAFLFALFYTLISGMQLPALRALVMLSVPLFCTLAGVKPKASTVWLFALLMVMLVDPMSPLSTGFWYSFLAVAVLIMLFSSRPQTQHSMKKIIKAQLGIFLLMVLLGLYINQPVYPLAPLLNLIAIPLVGVLLVPMLMLAVGVAPLIPQLASLLIVIIEPLQFSLLWLIELVSINSPKFTLPGLSNLTLYIGLIAVGLILLPASAQVRPLMTVLLMLVVFGRPIPSRVLDVAVLDVGQGLAVVVETRNHALVFDTGMHFPSGFTMARAVIEPYLKHRQISKIDHLVVSHADLDHRGGVPHLLSEFKVTDISVGGDPSLLRSIIGSRACNKNQSWHWDGVRFSFLWGYGADFRGNDGSCVLLIEFGDEALLLTGDISEKVEKALVDNVELYLPKKLSMLVVPHHGSSSSSSWSFVKHISPRYAVASAGYKNAFGHPTTQVIHRYQTLDSEFFNTAYSGTVIFSVGAKGTLELESEYRLANPRYWW